MAGHLQRWKRTFRPTPARPGAGRLGALCVALGVIALTAVGVTWLRTSRSASKEAPQTAGEVKSAVPLLELECSGLGIGSGQDAVALILDDSGVIRPPQDAAAALPTFVFEPIQGIVIGQPGPEPIFELAAGIARKWRPEWEKRLGPVTRISAQGGCCVTMETAQGVTVKFLAGDLERQFRNLTWIWRQTEKEGREIATVNLIPERNVPVTFR